MSVLKIYEQDKPTDCEVFDTVETIGNRLNDLGIRFERWKTDHILSDSGLETDILSAYRVEVDRIMQENGFQSVDVISFSANHPDKVALRDQFLSEHIHTEDEVRFVIDGQGLFYFHLGEEVYSLLCEKGDLLSVPAGMQHWFDMGENPHFKCIRFFKNSKAWVAQYTEDTIAKRFPLIGEE